MEIIIGGIILIIAVIMLIINIKNELSGCKYCCNNKCPNHKKK